MMNAHLTLFPPPRHGSAPHTVIALGKAIAGCVAIGFVLAALLWATSPSWSVSHGDSGDPSFALAESSSLDLSKPIFIKGALCPYEGLLASFSEANSQGCLVVDSTKPVLVVATATNGLQDQVFQVDMDTAEGTVEGWVASNSLRN